MRGLDAEPRHPRPVAGDCDGKGDRDAVVLRGRRAVYHRSREAELADPSARWRGVVWNLLFSAKCDAGLWQCPVGGGGTGKRGMPLGGNDFVEVPAAAAGPRSAVTGGRVSID